MNASITASAAGRSLAQHLADAPVPTEPSAPERSLHHHLWLPLAAAAALLAVWSHIAPLSGAVVAAGTVQAEYGRKTVQHQEGGIVRELLVRNGQAVRRGDALMVVGDLRSDAALALLETQRQAERLRAARVQAEGAGAATVRWPVDADPASETLQRERRLFETRRQTLDQQLAAQQQQLGQARAREQALKAQLETAERAAALAHDELELNRPLVGEGFIQKTRLMAMERTLAELQGRSASSRGQIAEARAQAASTNLAIAQTRGQYQQRAADEHKEATARLREIEDRLRPSQDQADRQIVRAPVDGTVMALRVAAVGAAVGPRETLLDIAPSNEALLIEVAIEPQRIDHARVGGAAQVRLTAFDARGTPLLAGRVRAVAPDAAADPGTQRLAYKAQVEVPAAELARHAGLRLQAGMPAEVFITTAARSLLEYLLEPLGLFGQRALREP